MTDPRWQHLTGCSELRARRYSVNQTGRSVSRIARMNRLVRDGASSGSRAWYGESYGRHLRVAPVVVRPRFRDEWRP